MTRSNTRQLVIALVFAIFMTGFFWISALVDPASATVSVTVQAEDQYGNIILPPTPVDVEEGYASSFSNSFYNDSPASDEDVTALDALFAAHDAKYPNVFSNNNYSTYIGGSASYITKMFGISAGSGYDFPAIMFAVNGMQPRDENDPNHQFQGWGANGPATGYWTYAMNQSVLQDGDVVNYFFINAYDDLYAFIRMGSDDYLDLDPLDDELFNTTNTLYLKGYEYFTYGYLEESGWQIDSIQNATIVRASDGVTVGSTGNNGLITLNSDLLASGANQLVIKPTASSPFFISVFFTIVK